MRLLSHLTQGIQHSEGRRKLIAALVELAHEQGAQVVAEGIERVDEYETMLELGVDLGQGFYFGHPTARPMDVDPRLFTKRSSGANFGWVGQRGGRRDGFLEASCPGGA